MGAWGAGAFENDAAMDWVAELGDSPAPATLKRALTRAAKTKAGKPVDLDDAIEALAAAEVVAFARGRGVLQVPDEIHAWVSIQEFTPDGTLTPLAIQAVERVAADSELKDEWNGDPAWLREQAKLVTRLRKRAKSARRKPAATPEETEPPPAAEPWAADVAIAPLERAMKNLKLRVYVNGDGEPREIVPSDTPTIADADMHWLAPLKTLEGFHLGESRLTDACAVHLRGLKKLTWAWLMETKVGDAVAAALASSSPRLCDLRLSRTAVTDAGLRHLAALRQLRILRLDGTNVTGEAFAKFADGSRLEVLDLSETRTTDAGLRHVARFKRLDQLWLGSTNVTDAGVARLVTLRRLTALDLDGTKVTDASIPHLARLRRLRSLYLNGVSMTRAGVKRLAEALPETEIET